MGIMRTAVLTCGLLFVSCCLHAQIKVLPETGYTAKPCQGLVQKFYDWYVPIARKGGGSEPSWDTALKEKSKFFGHDLNRQLAQEDKIQAKVSDAGLDSDPFLNSQDPAQRYEVGGAQHVGDMICWAS